MSFNFHAIAFGGYAFTIVLALFAEFAPWRQYARASVRAALALAVVSGGSWCYGVHLQGYVLPPYEAPQRAKKGIGPAVMLADGKGGGGPLRIRGHAGVGEPVFGE